MPLWCSAAAELLVDRDTEWGFPVSDDDHRLCEKLSLEGFQFELSWCTILAKGESFRAAFCDFDVDGIARFTQCDLDRLFKDEGIVRHHSKIEAVWNEARLTRELVKREGSLAAFIWRYEPDKEHIA